MQCSTLKTVTLPICVIFIIKQLELPFMYLIQMSKQTYRHYKHTVGSNNSERQESALKLITLPVCVIFIIKQLEPPLMYSMIFRCAKQANNYEILYLFPSTG